jgi:uncharacterized protein YbjT (DUF2867 family)
MTQTAIVIGATGLVGNALLKQLLNTPRFCSVVAFTRRDIAIKHSKLTTHIIDFDKLSEYSHLIKGDVFFSCLGTTKKQAGSISAQKKVDFDYQLTAAHIAANNGVAHYCLVSSSGANIHSRSGYLKMKGELEQHVLVLPFPLISIFQPSLLVGKRSKIRIAERIGGVILPIITKLPCLKRYTPIAGEQVAHKMVCATVQQTHQLQYYVLDELFT